jgi:hypothetical protein
MYGVCVWQLRWMEAQWCRCQYQRGRIRADAEICGHLPVMQSMHASELDAPVAELYVPANGARKSAFTGRGPVSSMVSGERCAGADHGPPRQ